ncbi:MAG TPA: type IV toxin-antitoxin system AbiEi family antitoxin [Candidatus Acidoferrales bacterium]|nr:type IV toxin-antitoxin system AbiEi family antitoxin [Candidatus Acidoferrales bacterium]
MSKAREYIANLAASGQHHFAVAEMAKSLGVSHAAAKLALIRLAKHGLVASPARGFDVIVPPEYKRLGCLPAEQFIPALMERLRLTYYAGLLSAAQYHGAAHHRPQEFQVLVAKNRRSINCGTVRVSFIARKRIIEVPVQSFNTPRGPILVSTVEATALDLVGYERIVGGLDQVATLLSELAEKIDPEKLVAAAHTAPISWAQRLGYILELVGAAAHLAPLKDYVRTTAKNVTPLLPAVPHKNVSRVNDWRLFVNTQVEAEM